ncbi:hypothetical protein SAPIO_CDS6142 [Scedosporium apiospermum]|uniref:Secreted protein n=1 Tax=Pseudallescheria apiosperma TaxID=563466 RepID=A0A084G4L9_PSEDA|nr:uncharacterized protein SAPIO_CDS6142 [Scedosporium apiospermum]KEZ42281.1 hypothetical protein SAPIO_CDS6142 [Scedosporium apiospermum]
MKFLCSILFLGLAAAAPLEAFAPLPNEVKIVGISAIGSGCPVGHAFATVDSTGTIFDVAFDQYVVETGPNTSASDARKNCRVSLNIEFPQGLQFSVVDTTFSGYASLASGQTGTCRAAYSFSGGGGSVAAQKTIRGPVDTNYEMNEKVDLITWSPCGDYTAILNVNSEVRITPTSSTSRGLMTVDSFDGRLHVQFAAYWRSC